MEHQAENFHQQIRDIIPELKQARINVFQKEVLLKKVFYVELVKAKDEGERSYNAQKQKQNQQKNITKHHWLSLLQKLNTIHVKLK